VSDEILAGRGSNAEENDHNKIVLIADDSSVARNQIRRTLEQLDYKCELVKDGAEALAFVKALSQKPGKITDYLHLVISDEEMPNMDGYTLTTELRKDSDLQNLYIILHTSLSGVFNQAMVQKVGADEFIPKFKPDDLAQAVMKGIEVSKSRQHVT
jgi:two-component system chemotaxis response regulator CheV